MGSIHFRYVCVAGVCGGGGGIWYISGIWMLAETLRQALVSASWTIYFDPFICWRIRIWMTLTRVFPVISFASTVRRTKFLHVQDTLRHIFRGSRGCDAPAVVGSKDLSLWFRPNLPNRRGEKRLFFIWDGFESHMGDWGWGWNVLILSVRLQILFYLLYGITRWADCWHFFSCFSHAGQEYHCSKIDYFPKDEYTPDPNDSTMAIPCKWNSTQYANNNV